MVEIAVGIGGVNRLDADTATAIVFVLADLHLRREILLAFVLPGFGEAFDRVADAGLGDAAAACLPDARIVDVERYEADRAQHALGMDAHFAVIASGDVANLLSVLGVWLKPAHVHTERLRSYFHLHDIVRRQPRTHAFAFDKQAGIIAHLLICLLRFADEAHGFIHRRLGSG